MLARMSENSSKLCICFTELKWKHEYYSATALLCSKNAVGYRVEVVNK